MEAVKAMTTARPIDERDVYELRRLMADVSRPFFRMAASVMATVLPRCVISGTSGILPFEPIYDEQTRAHLAEIEQWQKEAVRYALRNWAEINGKELPAF